MEQEKLSSVEDTGPKLGRQPLLKQRGAIRMWAAPDSTMERRKPEITKDFKKDGKALGGLAQWTERWPVG